MYKCAICGTNYESIVGRNKCETNCLKNFKIEEKKKSDIVRITNLFEQYFEQISNLESLNYTINSELVWFKDKYGMLFADKDIIDKLQNTKLPGKPLIIGNDKCMGLCPNETDVEIFKRCKDHIKIYDNVSELEQEIMNKIENKDINVEIDTTNLFENVSKQEFPYVPYRRKAIIKKVKNNEN